MNSRLFKIVHDAIGGGARCAAAARRPDRGAIEIRLRGFDCSIVGGDRGDRAFTRSPGKASGRPSSPPRIGTIKADGSSAERLLKSADLALCKAKSDGRNCIRFFLPEMDVELKVRVELELIIREAVLHDRCELHYQPLFEMSDRRLVGFEALIRLPKGMERSFHP